MPDPGDRSAGDARFASTVFVKATLRPGAGASFGVAANPLPVAIAVGRQMEGVTDFYARSASSRRRW